jgi:hypothetical protein
MNGEDSVNRGWNSFCTAAYAGRRTCGACTGAYRFGYSACCLTARVDTTTGCGERPGNLLGTLVRQLGGPLRRGDFNGYSPAGADRGLLTLGKVPGQLDERAWNQAGGENLKGEDAVAARPPSVRAGIVAIVKVTRTICKFIDRDPRQSDQACSSFCNPILMCPLLSTSII